MAVTPTTQSIYDKVNAHIKAGLNTSAACAKVGEELGRPRASIATTYYRAAAKDPNAAPRTSRRGRPRKSASAPSATTKTAARAKAASASPFEDALVAAAAELTNLREENARLKQVLAEVSRLVAPHS